jgi:hypothetical protein
VPAQIERRTIRSAGECAESRVDGLDEEEDARTKGPVRAVRGPDD